MDRDERRRRMGAILTKHDEAATVIRAVVAACAAASPVELLAAWHDTYAARDEALAQAHAATLEAIQLLKEMDA